MKVALTFSGEKVAPCLTIFIGGNHEASNHLQEIPYGGWAAPNIYYLGSAGVVNFAGLRIAGLSGIWKGLIFQGYDYRKGHYETFPYSEEDLRSVYHVREIEFFRLSQIKRPVNIFMSHDWPRGILNYGDKEKLFHYKKFLRSEEHTLGNPVGMDLLRRLQPSYWFAAHLHCKFPAIVPHSSTSPETLPTHSQDPTPQDEVPTNLTSSEKTVPTTSEDSIPTHSQDPPTKEDSLGEPPSQKVTKFLALSKPLYGSDFLQVLDMPSTAPKELSYDLEWLAILLLTEHFPTTSRGPGVPLSISSTRCVPTPDELSKATDLLHASNTSLVISPQQFQVTVPPYVPAQLPNTQTDNFLKLLDQLRPAFSLSASNPEEISLELETPTANPDEISLDDL